jgi:GH43 family beta-xylosidase
MKAVLLALWLVGWNVSAPVLAGAVQNPLIQQRADPFILADRDGYFYYTGTVPEYDRIVLRGASTLADLPSAPDTVIWRKHAKGPMAAHIRAPDLHRIDGNWYIYFAAGRSDDIWAIRLYVLESTGRDPLRGPWVEKGQLETEFESFTLDATTFVHRGQRYLVWAQRPLTPPGAGTDLYIARMKNPWTIEGPQVSISSPTLEWETRGLKVNEGPAVIERNGRVFITYSASAPDANYCVGLLSAAAEAELVDAKSWTKSPRPIFASSEKNKQYGPGHNSFLVAQDGVTDLIVYHARNSPKIEGDPLHDPNRHTRIQPFGWKADGTPDFGEPVADGSIELSGRTKH